MNNYSAEAKKRWGGTAAHREYEIKTAGYAPDTWQRVNQGLDEVLARFAGCMQSGHAADSPAAQALVNELQDYITAHYYTCTDEILAGLGRMYVADKRFRANMDSHGAGTAAFISSAIESYCK